MEFEMCSVGHTVCSLAYLSQLPLSHCLSNADTERLGLQLKCSVRLFVGSAQANCTNTLFAFVELTLDSDNLEVGTHFYLEIALVAQNNRMHMKNVCTSYHSHVAKCTR